LEYRRHANDSWSGSARNRMFAIFLLPVCYLFATCLLLICYLFATCLLSVCYLFAICLLSLPSAVKRVRHVSDVYTAAPKGFPFRIPVIFLRHLSEINRPPSSCCSAMPDGLANTSRPHSKLRTRSPLSGGFMMAFRALAGF